MIWLHFYYVRLIVLEPTRPKSPDPKSGASTNFATGAKAVQRLWFYFNRPKREVEKGSSLSQIGY